MIYVIPGFESTMRRLTAFAILFLLVLPLSGCLDEQDADDGGGDGSDSYISRMQGTTEDHADEVSTNTNDNLMNYEVIIMENVELQWSDLIITLADDDDGTNQITCSNPGQSSASDCAITEIQGNGDGFFDVGEKITVSENGVDICSSYGCNKVITIYGDSTRFADNQPWDQDQEFME